MVRQILSGNEALALGALQAGVKVVAGYPGTPSTRALASLLAMNLNDRHIEWSANEKVALEIAAAAAWSGQRSLCTMKMSGVNVAYDSLASIAYSGVVGGMVIYVADDPGANAGMVEQDLRGFAVMTDLPMLEPPYPEQAYTLAQYAFELSEQVGSPVFVRMVTAVANSKTAVEVQYPPAPALERKPKLINDINRFTKAGSLIATNQHRDVIARLEAARQAIALAGLNQLRLAEQPGGLGVIASGAAIAYLDESFALAEQLGVRREDISTLEVVSVHPFPKDEAAELLRHCGAVLVLEELEPLLEQQLYVLARQREWPGKITGKLDGTLSRVGAYDVRQALTGLTAALGLPEPAELFQGHTAETLASPRPITVCAGCPHRGAFLAINRSLKKLGYRKGEVMVTGDIGCTILGMNPPFNTVWNEVSMGASIGMAQGFIHAGVQTPVIATIGDSTFFHAGLPGLINAVQHQTPLTLIILDNGWTAMTGMQINPGTGEDFQSDGGQRVDIARIIPALGIEHFTIVDPYDLEATGQAIQAALPLPGVKVILARRECAIQSLRRGVRKARITIDESKCPLCKLCINLTGCPALSIEDGRLVVDESLCTGCGLCAEVCNLGAIQVELIE